VAGMTLRHNLAWCVAQLPRYLVQNALVALGLAIGVANIIMLISITDLGRHQTMGFINDLGANVLVVIPALEAEKGAVAHMMSSISTRHLPAGIPGSVAQADCVEGVAPVLSMPAHIGYGASRYFSTVLGVNEDFLRIRGHTVEHGRWFSPAEGEGANAALLGPTVAEELIAGKDPVGEEIVLKGQKLTVLGVMASKGKIGMEDIDNTVLVPLKTAQELFGVDGIHGMFVRYKQGTRPDDAIAAVRARIEPFLSENEDLEDEISILTIKEATDLMDSTLGIFRTVLVGIAAISLLVGAIGITNVMLMRVVLRKLEIGVRLSVGARRRDILAQFLGEALVLTLLGAVAGVCLGIIGVWIYCNYAGWSLYISPLTVLLSVVFCSLVGLGAGIMPAAKAARLDPIASLRHEQ